MAKMLNVPVSVVPSEGKLTEKVVEVAASGASVKEICDQGGIDTRDKDFTVNGRPATLDTHVGPDDALEAKERRRAAVTVSERPQGS